MFLLGQPLDSVFKLAAEGIGAVRENGGVCRVKVDDPCYGDEFDTQ